MFFPFPQFLPLPFPIHPNLRPSSKTKQKPTSKEKSVFVSCSVRETVHASVTFMCRYVTSHFAF